MKDNLYFKDSVTFLRWLHMSPPRMSNFVTILNMMDTIREYREYTHPVSPTWEKYIFDVFHILGFITKAETPRLLSLSDIGGKGSRRAIVVLVKPDENLNDVVPGLEWATVLHLSLHYYQVDWGIITDGLKLKIFYRNQEFTDSYMLVNLEDMLTDNNFEIFFDFCNIISMIRGSRTNAIEKTQDRRGKPSGIYDLNYHLANKSNVVQTIFEVLRSKIKSLSDHVEERVNRMYIGYYTHISFCQIQPQRNQIKIWISLDIHQISDPLHLCHDVSKIGHHGMGKTEITINKFNQIDGVFDIIEQAYRKNNNPDHQININSQSTRKLRNKFWTELLEKANRKTSLHANISPGQDNWISAGAGKSGLSYVYVARLNDAQVELYIAGGDQIWNKNTFGYFFQRKEELELNFGAALDWQLLEERRASRIRFVIYDYGLKDQLYWSTLQELLIDGMIRLQKTFQPLIAQID